MSSVLLRCIARSVVKHFANFATFGVGEELLIDIWDTWQHQQDEARRRAEIEQLAGASATTARQMAEQAVAADAAALSSEQRAVLVDYLAQTPAVIRRTLKRPADPSGRTVPPGASLRSSDDLKKMLAAKPARFKAGDRPIANVDLELVELLGVGGFGEVWKARNPELDSAPAVALKFCTDEQAKQRLLTHEKRVINQVQRQGKHDGIVPLLRTYLSAEPPCLEYEYVEGGDLAGLIEEWHSKSVATPERVARLVMSLAEIVAYAHAQSPPVVHRDLKPANILVQASGVASAQASGGRKPPVDDLPTLRITDFGIGGLALLAEHNQGTKGTAALATVARGTYTHLYASPQQVAGRDPDPRDDVYALGVVWYQALTGQLNVGAPTGSAWTRRLRERGMAAELVDLLCECLEHAAEDRPASAAVLTARLSAALKQPAPPPQPAPLVTPPKPAVVPPPRPTLSDEITNSIGMKLRLIPAGKFLMGSPPSEEYRSNDEYQHEVELTLPFYMGVYQVTQAEYEKVMGNNPSHFNRKVVGQDTSRCPVECVSWEEAMAFCAKLNERDEMAKKGWKYTLPSEAQWEYACRGPASSKNHSAPFHFGTSLSSRQANFDGNYPYGAEEGPYLNRICEVGSYQPNGYGLYDMHGNVWEWCLDWHGVDYYKESPTKDPHGPSKGSNRVDRGGSWFDVAWICRSANRDWNSPAYSDGDLGFRLVVVPAGE